MSGTGIQRPAFDYGVLEESARTIVKGRTAEIHGLIRMTAQTVIKIGSKLVEVQPLLEGHFCAWLRSEFVWSERTALNFMSVYETFGGEPAVANFAPSALYLLSSPSVPEEARKTALKIAGSGQRVTHKKAKEMVSHSLSRATGAGHNAGSKGFATWLTAEPEVAESPQLFYVNRLTQAILNGYLNLKEDRLTYALHGLADLIKERVPRHPPK